MFWRHAYYFNFYLYADIVSNWNNDLLDILKQVFFVIIKFEVKLVIFYPITILLRLYLVTHFL
jgi:hypothetical protein